MRKHYVKPETEVIVLQQQCQLLAGSDLTKYDDPADLIDDPTLIW